MARRRRRNPSGRTLAISVGAVGALAVVGFLWWRKRQQDAHMFDAPPPLYGSGPRVPTTTVTPSAATKILQAVGLKTAPPVRST